MSASPSKINLLDLSRQQMREFFASLGEKSFRADQAMKWIYHYGMDSFEDMNNFSKALRAKLAELCVVEGPEIAVKQQSSDGTIKYAMKLRGGQEVETVWIQTVIEQLYVYLARLVVRLNVLFVQQRNKVLIVTCRSVKLLAKYGELLKT